MITSNSPLQPHESQRRPGYRRWTSAGTIIAVCIAMFMLLTLTPPVQAQPRQAANPGSASLAVATQSSEPTSVDLTIPEPEIVPGANIRFTATPDKPLTVNSSIQVVQIQPDDSVQSWGYCSYGGTCTGGMSLNHPDPIQMVAILFVGTREVDRSDPVTVRWKPYAVSLEFDKTVVAWNEQAPFRAPSNYPLVRNTSILVLDLSTNRTSIVCSYGGVCSGSVTHNSVTPARWVAILRFHRGSETRELARSNVVMVSLRPYQVQLSVDKSQVSSPSEAFRLTATRNQPGFSWSIYDADTNQLVSGCASEMVACEAVRQLGQASVRRFVATVSDPSTGNRLASSNVVSVTHCPLGATSAAPGCEQPRVQLQSFELVNDQLRPQTSFYPGDDIILQATANVTGVITIDDQTTGQLIGCASLDPPAPHTCRGTATMPQAPNDLTFTAKIADDVGMLLANSNPVMVTRKPLVADLKVQRTGGPETTSVELLPGEQATLIGKSNAYRGVILEIRPPRDSTSLPLTTCSPRTPQDDADNDALEEICRTLVSARRTNATTYALTERIPGRSNRDFKTVDVRLRPYTIAITSIDPLPQSDGQVELRLGQSARLQAQLNQGVEGTDYGIALVEVAATSTPGTPQVLRIVQSQPRGGTSGTPDTVMADFDPVTLMAGQQSRLIAVVYDRAALNGAPLTPENLRIEKASAPIELVSVAF